MIGTIVGDHVVIAAVPNGVPGALSVTAKRSGHRPNFVTWMVTKGEFRDPHFFTAHDVDADTLRDKALADMFWRAGFGRLLMAEMGPE